MVEGLLAGKLRTEQYSRRESGAREGVREDAVGAQGGKINISSSVCEDRCEAYVPSGGTAERRPGHTRDATAVWAWSTVEHRCGLGLPQSTRWLRSLVVTSAFPGGKVLCPGPVTSGTMGSAALSVTCPLGEDGSPRNHIPPWQTCSPLPCRTPASPAWNTSEHRNPLTGSCWARLARGL